MPAPSDNLLSPDLAARSCRLTTERVLAIKRILIARYRASGVSSTLIRDAIAAAEAKAWLTGFPHLFLPDLADEILDQRRQKQAASHPEYAVAA